VFCHGYLQDIVLAAFLICSSGQAKQSISEVGVPTRNIPLFTVSGWWWE